MHPFRDRWRCFAHDDRRYRILGKMPEERPKQTKIGQCRPVPEYKGAVLKNGFKNGEKSGIALFDMVPGFWRDTISVGLLKKKNPL